MAYTQAQIDALQAAIASGELSVQYQDRKTVYRSLAEMRETLEMMRREVNGAPSGGGRVYPTVSKGLGSGGCR